mmetsp:Transcript_21290/g.38471  ORF Transcript_21290/g.38471 Transcript_21290/m.38471 type:complete len:290 (+) Transcript_21290:5880-6749(+)
MTSRKAVPADSISSSVVGMVLLVLLVGDMRFSSFVTFVSIRLKVVVAAISMVALSVTLPPIVCTRGTRICFTGAAFVAFARNTNSVSSASTDLVGESGTEEVESLSLLSFPGELHGCGAFILSGVSLFSIASWSSRIVARAEEGAVIHRRRFAAGPVLLPSPPNAPIMFMAALLPLKLATGDGFTVANPSSEADDAAFRADWKSAFESILNNPLLEAEENADTVLSSSEYDFDLCDIAIGRLSSISGIVFPLRNSKGRRGNVLMGAAFASSGDTPSSSIIDFDTISFKF